MDFGARQLGSADASVPIDPSMQIDQDDDSNSAADSGATASRHVCHCGKTFIRKEHLKRHQANHGDPSFKCEECGQGFTRNDLLKRHARVHTEEYSAEKRKGRACDACHINRSRCSGGAQCTLCAKRGVPCTYNRKGAPSNDFPEASSHPPDASVSKPRTLKIDQLPPSLVDFLSTCIVRTAPEKRLNNPQTGDIASGMEAVYQIVISPEPVDTLEEYTQAFPEFKKWVDGCAEAYLEHVHPRWPVLHGPTIDVETAPLSLSASVLMLGCWLRGEGDGEWIVATHEVMVKRAFDELTKGAVTLPDARWPIELYQAIFLNILFGVFWGEEQTTTRATLLCRVFVSVLREAGMFSQRAIAQQQKTFYPGTFMPYLVAAVQQIKRLAVSLFVLDAYVSLLHDAPPSLQGAELDFPVPCTFALWNAHPISEMFARHAAEPQCRGTRLASDVASGELVDPADASAPVQQLLLLEDVQLGLAGAQAAVWRWTARIAQRPNTLLLLQPACLVPLEVLDSLATELETSLLLLVTGQASNDDDNSTTALLLSSYRGSPNDPSALARWKHTPLQRAMMAVYDCTLLYHLQCLRLLSDPALFAFAPEAKSKPWDLEGQGSGEMFIPDGSSTTAAAAAADRVRGWARTRAGRRSLIHAFAVLESIEVWGGEYGGCPPPGQRRRRNNNPVQDVAAASALAVLRAWMTTTTAETGGWECRCGEVASTTGAMSLLVVEHVGPGPARMESNGPLRQWVEQGAMAVVINGVRVCGCSLPGWVAQWEGAMRDVQTGT